MTGQSLGDAWHETCLGWEGAAAPLMSSAGGEGEQSEPVGGVVGAGLDARPVTGLAWHSLAGGGNFMPRLQQPSLGSFAGERRGSETVRSHFR
jgi:hypothetical protein